MTRDAAMSDREVRGAIYARAGRRFPPRRFLVLAASALLIGCSDEPASDAEPAIAAAPSAAPEATPPPASSVAPSPAPLALAIEGEGLRLFDPATGSSRPLPFGTPWDRVLAALSARGEPTIGRNEECGAGPLDYARWEDSLTLYGQGGKFVGWFADGGAAGSISTAAGVGPGSTRRDLEGVYAAEVSESTLGTEFAADDLFGLLDSPHPDSPITAMWAGTSCNFR